MSGGPSTPQTPDAGQSPPAQTPASTPAASPPSDTGYSPEEDSVIDVLRYDPFEAGKVPASQPKAAGANASPGQVPPRSDVPAPQQPAQSPAQPAPSDGTPGSAPAAAASGTDALASAAQALTAAAERMGQAPTQGQQPSTADDVPPYIFDIPPQLMNALNSEDPQQRQVGVQQLVAGTARAVHTNVIKLMNEVKAQLPNIVNAQLQAHTYRENVRRDFYGKYPMLDNPHLAPTVASVTQQVMTEIVANGGRPSWSPQLGQTIAERVFALIPGLKPAAAAPQNGSTPPSAQPPHIFTQGSRPGMQGRTIADDISDTLFGN